MAFDILAVVSIDLRAMWAKLDVLRWVIGNVHPLATGHHVTATFAFLEGERCGRGQKQLGFFARPLPEPGEAVDYAEDDRDGGSEDARAEDDSEIDDNEVDDDDDEEVTDPSPEELDRALRMAAVEKRAEHFTACGMVALLCAAKDIAQDLVDTWAAFGRFCHGRLGVSPETMLKAWQFPLVEFKETLDQYEKVKPNPAKVTEYFGYITKQWDRRFPPRPPGYEYLTYADDDGSEGGDGCG
jgi:hypothetical protein